MSAEHKAKLDGDVEVSSTTLAYGQYLPGTGFKLHTFARLVDRYTLYLYVHSRDHSPLMNLSQDKNDQLPLTVLTFTNRDVTRWNMAWRAVQTCKLVEHTVRHEPTELIRPGVERLPRLLTERCEDWPTFEDLADLPILFGFSFAAFVYGGLHALAWSAHFNSNNDQLLWRSSACVVMGGFPVAAITKNYLLDEGDDMVTRRSYSQKVWMQRATIFIIWTSLMCLYVCLILLLGLVPLAYILARAYLVVECFINLSHLPAGAYDVPSWSAYFPHIS